jgi:CheY-like chemotaxis protein
MMGGRIEVESEPGQGSTFVFTAAFGIAGDTVAPRPEAPPDLRGLKALVVDDNPTSREILEEMLESFSFEVGLACSGEEAIAEMTRAEGGRPYELVVMDWKMGGMDGIEAARRIKALPGLKAVPPIILVTAYGREEIMRQAEAAGLSGFLLKPVSPSVMFDTIMQAFGRDESRPLKPGEAGSSPADASQRLMGARVLLVEDNEINQQVAREILAGGGLAVTVADNGQAAFDRVRAESFDAVLMDVQMPVMDGYTATRAIRQWEAEVPGGRARLPIIAMTAHAMAGDHERSLAAGMDDHVTKPIDPAQLFAALTKWIGPRSAAEAAAAPVQAPAPGGETELPDRLPEFDIQEGLQRLVGNRALYRKLLVNFATQYRDAAVTIRQALDAGDYTQAHGLVHAVKGVAGNLSAKDLQSQAAGLEKSVKHVDPAHPPTGAELDAAFEPFQAALERALAAVEPLVPAAPASPAPGPEADGELPPALAREAAARLREAAELGDVSGLAAVCDDLAAKSPAFAPYKAKVAQLADDFDFDGVLRLAEELER